MWPYWLLYIFPAFAALHNGRVMSGQVPTERFFRLSRGWFIVVTVLTLIIGLRYEVGGDWGNYLRAFEGLRYKSLQKALISGDPGYQLVQWVSMDFGWGIYGVNLICGLLFSLGLVAFCRNLPRPWLALAVAVPYLVIVVGMGYTRQGIAIGLAMLGLVALGHQSVKTFIFWVCLAAAFHKSVVLLLPIAALAVTKRRVWTTFWVSLITIGAYFLMLEDSVDYYKASYLEAEYQSAGAMIRLLMNALPAAILLIWRRRFAMTFAQFNLWKWCSIISLGLLVLLFISPSSTAVDRVALLFLPLQSAVFSYIPEVFGTRTGRNTFFTVVILAYYAAIQFVWLNYASHAHAWVPYKFYLLVDTF